MMRNIIRIKGGNGLPTTNNNDTGSSAATTTNEMEFTTESILTELEESCFVKEQQLPPLESSSLISLSSNTSSSGSSNNSSTGSSTSSTEYYDNITQPKTSQRVGQQQRQQQVQQDIKSRRISNRSSASNSSSRGFVGLLTSTSHNNSINNSRNLQHDHRHSMSTLATDCEYDSEQLLLRCNNNTTGSHTQKQDDQSIAAMECLVMSMNEIQDELRDKCMECTVLHDTIHTISHCLQQCEQQNEVLKLQNEQLILSLQSLTFTEFILPLTTMSNQVQQHQHHPFDRYNDDMLSTSTSDSNNDQFMHSSDLVAIDYALVAGGNPAVSKRTAVTSSSMLRITPATTTSTDAITATTTSTHSEQSPSTRTQSKLPPTPETFHRLLRSSSFSSSSTSSSSSEQQRTSSGSSTPVCVDDVHDDDDEEHESSDDELGKDSNEERNRIVESNDDDGSDEEKKDDGDDGPGAGSETNPSVSTTTTNASFTQQQPTIVVGPSQAHFYSIIKERDALQHENRVYKRKIQSMQNQLQTTKQQLHHCYNLLELLYNPNHHSKSKKNSSSSSTSTLSSKQQLVNRTNSKHRRGNVTTSKKTSNDVSYTTSVSSSVTSKTIDDPITDSMISADDDIYSDLFLPRRSSDQHTPEIRSNHNNSGISIVDEYVESSGGGNIQHPSNICPTVQSNAATNTVTHGSSIERNKLQLSKNTILDTYNEKNDIGQHDVTTQEVGSVFPPPQRRCQEYALEIDQYPWRRNYGGGNKISQSTTIDSMVPTQEPRIPKSSNDTSSSGEGVIDDSQSSTISIDNKNVSSPNGQLAGTGQKIFKAAESTPFHV